MKIIPLPPQEVPVFFPKIRPLIEKVMELTHGELTMEDLYRQLCEVKTILWIISDETYNPKAFMITEVNQYPRKKVIRVLMLSGIEMAAWKESVIKTLTIWGKKIGATGIEVIGRKGWERELQADGFKVIHTTLLKEI